MANWQPVETAPRDGTNVLLVWEWDSGLRTGVAVVLAHWHCNKHAHLSRHKDCPNESDCIMRWGAYGGQMTHWMPLPDPPSHALAAQEGE